MLVERDGHADARAAECDAEGHLTRLDGLGQRVGVVGVVDALGRIGPEVEHFVALGTQVAHQKLLHLVAGVVAGDSYFFLHNRVVSFFIEDKYSNYWLSTEGRAPVFFDTFSTCRRPAGRPPDAGRPPASSPCVRYFRVISSLRSAPRPGQHRSNHAAKSSYASGCLPQYSR